MARERLFTLKGSSGLVVAAGKAAANTSLCRYSCLCGGPTLSLWHSALSQPLGTPQQLRHLQRCMRESQIGLGCAIPPALLTGGWTEAPATFGVAAGDWVAAGNRGGSDGRQDSR
ncbi:hypothetical protein Pmani_026473 [Petrolisthes manimaculis]|uniref:Uncharacterized protein n=1 Tax=Petrolisthes manimaculis TaxID=1843537 RepID=A0AAE1P5Y6_9EUCA|nr:hypothetical protein Pmani_026473 [Petrolisthes manimaculis]